MSHDANEAKMKKRNDTRQKQKIRRADKVRKRLARGGPTRGAQIRSRRDRQEDPS